MSDDHDDASALKAPAAFCKAERFGVSKNSA